MGFLDLAADVAADGLTVGLRNRVSFLDSRDNCDVQRRNPVSRFGSGCGSGWVDCLVLRLWLAADGLIV